MEDQGNTTTVPPPEVPPLKNGRRVVLFPVPLQGHINPMIQLANVLYSEGFSISIIHTKFNSIDPTKYPNFDFHLIPDGFSDDGDDNSSLDIVHLLKELNVNCMEPFRECLVKLMLEGVREPVACLITDTIWYFAQDVADSLKLPRIAFRTTCASSFLVFDAIPLFQAKGYLPKKDSQLEEEIPEFPPMKVKDIPEIKTRKPEAAYWLIAKMLEITKSASGLIFNTFKELEENELSKTAQDFQLRTFSIGPIHKYFPGSSSSSLLKQDHRTISWLDNRSPKSVLYVSFGSLAVMDETELSEVAWGLAESRQHFIWVIRPGLVHESLELDRLPKGFLEAVKERGFIVKWAPQEQVLAHPALGGFWTHSGWNSTLESICEGVPMICSPFFGDQMVNSRLVSDVWRVGVGLEKGFRRREIASAIRKVMVDQEGEEIRANIMFFKEKAQMCIKHGGSSYESLKSLKDFIMSL